MPIRAEAVVIGPGSPGMLRVQLGRPPGERVVNVRADCLPAQLRMPNASFVAEVEAGEVVGAATAGPEWLLVQDQIRRVLNADWDPIGVADQVQDEYDLYIDGLYRLIRAGSADEVIAEHLRTIEMVRMEYPGQPLDRLRSVAAKLRSLRLPAIDDSTMAEHPDSDALLNAVLPFAQRMLAKRGAFLPFGATVSSDGTVALAGGMSESEQGAAQKVIDVLLSGFKQQAAEGTIRGAAICHDGRAVNPQTGENVDSICPDIEHGGEGCASIFLPYKKGWFGKITYGALFGVPRDARVLVE